MYQLVYIYIAFKNISNRYVMKNTRFRKVKNVLFWDLEQNSSHFEVAILICDLKIFQMVLF